MVALSTLLGLQGGGTSFGSGARPKIIALTVSTLWVPQFSGEVIIHCSGGGGAGKSGDGGGGAGGYCKKRITVDTSHSYTATIGAGGDNGDGSPSSFVGHGHTLIANGGRRPVVDGIGGTGGTASGGDANVQGGYGHKDTASVYAGGGAVGILGVGNPTAANIENSKYGANVFDHIPNANALWPDIPTIWGNFDVSNLIGHSVPPVADMQSPGIGGHHPHVTGYEASPRRHGGLYAGGGGDTSSGNGGLGGGGGGRIHDGGDGLILVEILSAE